MSETLAIKVVLQQTVLYGSKWPELLQRVANVYVNGLEFRVSAPPAATGDSLDWVEHFTVRHLVDLNSEIDAPDEIAGLAVTAVVAELEKQKLPRNKVQGRHPDGQHCDAQICTNGHVLH